MNTWICPDCREGDHEWCSGGCSCEDPYHEGADDDGDTQWADPGEVA